MQVLGGVVDMRGVAWKAHVGGLLVGVALGLAWRGAETGRGSRA